MKEVDPDSLAIIVMVANQMGPKYLFPGRSQEDMIQEGILFGLRSFPKWDGVRPLENWLRVVMKSRYLNYIRDNYQRYEKTTDPEKAALYAHNNRTRQNIMSPISVSEVTCEIASNHDAHSDVAYAELVEIIKDKLPAKLRGDFLRMIDEVHIPLRRREKVREAVSVIMEEYNSEG